jgi:cephalosporin hydroxylase
MGKRVLVCGGRDYQDRAAVFGVLDGLHRVTPISAVISGMARGADALGAEWAKEQRVELAAYPADWTGHGRSAGPIRNRQMLAEAKPDLVVAFPGGRGTADMISISEKAGVPVVRITK